MPKLEKTGEYILSQKACCNHYGVEFHVCNEEQLIVVSEGVVDEKLEVEGVRYPSPNHMSGWWITTDLYDGNTDSLKTIHASHLFEARPDLAPYLGLPYGYRFLLGGESEHVWFDPSCT